MIEKLSQKFHDSLTGKIYYRIKKFPIVRVIFDFEYTAELWRKGQLFRLGQLLLRKLQIPEDEGFFRVNKYVFVLLLSLCLPLACLEKSEMAALLVFILSALFVPDCRNRNFPLVFVVGTVAEVIFFLLVPFFSAFIYIIYVETGMLMFFILKYLKRNLFLLFMKISVIWWLISAIFSNFLTNTHVLTLIFLPYSLVFFCKGKYKRYFYAAILLGIGFYSLFQGEVRAVIGGSLSMIILVMTGEWWLFAPILIIVPAVFSFVEVLIKNGAFTEKIIQTGIFFWKYGFGGKIAGENTPSGADKGYFKIISDISSGIIFVFFWYILRVSRSAVLKLFGEKGKNNRILRAGLGSFVGFSVYTFFAYGSNSHINIIVYLCGAAMLKRGCEVKRIREETGGNGRKTDFE